MYDAKFGRTYALCLMLLAAGVALSAPTTAYTDYHCLDKKFSGGFGAMPSGSCFFSCGNEMGAGVEVEYSDSSGTVNGHVKCAEVDLGCSGSPSCQVASPIMITYEDNSGRCDGSVSDSDFWGNDLYITCYTWWTTSFATSDPGNENSGNAPLLVSWIMMSVDGVGLARGEACHLNGDGHYTCLAVTPTCAVAMGLQCGIGLLEIEKAYAQGAVVYARAEAPAGVL